MRLVLVRHGEAHAGFQRRRSPARRAAPGSPRSGGGRPRPCATTWRRRAGSRPTCWSSASCPGPSRRPRSSPRPRARGRRPRLRPLRGPHRRGRRPRLGGVRRALRRPSTWRPSPTASSRRRATAGTASTSGCGGTARAPGRRPRRADRRGRVPRRGDHGVDAGPARHPRPRHGRPPASDQHRAHRVGARPRARPLDAALLQRDRPPRSASTAPAELADAASRRADGVRRPA